MSDHIFEDFVVQIKVSDGSCKLLKKGMCQS